MANLNYYYKKIRKEDVVYPLFTQPSMAFTPRQIIEQFASGEVIAEENHPTDEFYDDKYSEEQLMNLHAIQDDFMLRQHVLDFQENQQQNEQKKVDSGSNVSSSSETTSDSNDESGQPTEHGEQTKA